MIQITKRDGTVKFTENSYFEFTKDRVYEFYPSNYFYNLNEQTEYEPNEIMEIKWVQ